MHKAQLFWDNLRLQFISWGSKPFVWMGFLLGISLAFRPAFEFIRFAKAREAYINVFEAFIIIGSSKNYSMYALLGILILLSDAPFVDDMNIYISLRSSRYFWFMTKFAYIAISCVLYYILILIFTVLLSTNIGFVNNVWSKTMVQTARNEGVVFKYGVVLANDMLLEKFTPYGAVCVTLLLQSLYSIVLAGTMFLLNMKWNKGVGIFSALLIHGVGSWIISENIMANQLYSLLAHSLPCYHNLLRVWPDQFLSWISPYYSRYATIAESILVFAIIVAIQILMGFRISRRMSFVVPNRQI